MTRTAQRHIVPHVVIVRTEPQHIDAFAAEEGHARFDGIGKDPCAGEVLAKVRADFRQNVDHSAAGSFRCAPVGSIVRLTPVSASKMTIFDVSNANSIVWPGVTFDSVETLATNSFSAAPESA